MYKKSPKNIWQYNLLSMNRSANSVLLITHWCYWVDHSLQHQQQQQFYFLARLTALKLSLQMQSSQDVAFMSSPASFLMIANLCSNEIKCVLHPSRQCFLPHRCPVCSFPHHLKTVRLLKFLCCLIFSR